MTKRITENQNIIYKDPNADLFVSDGQHLCKDYDFILVIAFHFVYNYFDSYTNTQPNSFKKDTKQTIKKKILFKIIFNITKKVNKITITCRKSKVLNNNNHVFIYYYA